MEEFKVIVYFYKDGKIRRKEVKIEGTSYDVGRYLETVDDLYFAISTRKDENGKYIYAGEYIPSDLV